MLSQSKTALFGRYETKDLQDLPDKLNKAFDDVPDKPAVPLTLYQQMKQFEGMGIKVRYKKKDK